MPTAVRRSLRLRPQFLAALCVFTGCIVSVSALEWETGDGFRSAKVTVAPGGRTGFRLLSAAESGIQFTNTLSMDMCGRNQNLMSGAGVAVGDVDGDGLPDLYFCNLEGENALYRNLGGFKFENITERAGVACAGMFSVGATFADFNGDGALDLYVTSNDGPNAYFVNDGSGKFTNLTAQSGLALNRAGCTTPAVADVDGDGDLDLYVGAYGENTVLRSGSSVSYSTDRRGNTILRGRDARRLRLNDGILTELGETNVLFLNNGNNTFTSVSWTDGAFLDEKGEPLANAPLDLTLTTMFRDVDQDGDPDIYECNDFQTVDRLWINDGTGRFRLIDRLALRSESVFSMGVAFADINHDGLDDFLVCDMESRVHEMRMRQMGQTNPVPVRPGILDDRPDIRRNTLYLNRGDGTYAEIAWYAGLSATEWTWNPMFIDVDLDGWEDVLISNGHAYDTQDHDASEKVKTLGKQPLQVAYSNLQYYPHLITPNLAFRNQRDLTFQETGIDWGFNSSNVTHGLVYADLDLDGDPDVIANCLNDSPLVYENTGTGNRVSVRLNGLAPNTRGIGAKVKLLNGAVPSQHQEIQAGGHYLSGAEPMLTFAAGASPSMTLEVTWRNGNRSVIHDVKPNRIYEISESGAKPPASTPAPAPARPLFIDASDQLGHSHYEEGYDDLARQPLIYKKLSQPGPGIAWADLDGDGDDDLVIGSGLGGTMSVFRNEGAGKLQAWKNDLWAQPVIRDQTGMVAVRGAAGVDLLAGLSNYEDGLEIGPGVQSLVFEGNAVAAGLDLPATASAVGPLAVADLDGQGGMVLFVGGRALPGRFPEAASSQIYRRGSDGWKRDEDLSKGFDKVGLINAATFSDLNGDGLPELLLAVEWGTIRVFSFAGGKPAELTSALGLDQDVGWWQSVTTGDFDGDGRLDIVAGNIGLNSQYRASPTSPILAYYGDMDGFGGMEILEAYHEPASQRLVPRLDRKQLDAAMPWLSLKFPLHRNYSRATVQNILGPLFATTPNVSATELANVVYFNRGDRFEKVLLPAEAQWSCVFGMNVADFDGNGTEDLFLAQNFFAVSPEFMRLDAGRGLLLKNDGRGTFSPVSGSESGIKIYGESRGSAAADYDGDGRTDLVVSQNGTQTRLLKNEEARPGLRIRLEGTGENPDAIGAAIRLKSAGNTGPVRELKAGSGYLSQDSFIEVLSSPGPVDSVEVRWPGGRTTSSKVAANAREVRIRSNGELSIVQ